MPCPARCPHPSCRPGTDRSSRVGRPSLPAGVVRLGGAVVDLSAGGLAGVSSGSGRVPVAPARAMPPTVAAAAAGIKILAVSRPASVVLIIERLRCRGAGAR